MKIIGVIGSDGEIPKRVEKIAEKIGGEIAKSGFALVCGGRGGVMEAACKGAKKVGGTTLGILPGADRTEANEFVDIVIPTGMGYARNALVVLTSDAVIAIHGSVGTLSEIAMAMNYGKPVIVVKGSGGVSVQVKKLDDRKVAKIVEVDAAMAVKKALELTR